MLYLHTVHVKYRNTVRHSQIVERSHGFLYKILGKQQFFCFKPFCFSEYLRCTLPGMLPVPFLTAAVLPSVWRRHRTLFQSTSGDGKSLKIKDRKCIIFTNFLSQDKVEGFKIIKIINYYY